MKKLFFLIGIAFWGLASPAYAHRPFTSEDAGVLNPKEFELEIGHDYAKISRDESEWTGTYTLNAGIFPRVEADFTVPVYYDFNSPEYHTRGFGDLGLLGKLRLTAETPYLAAWTLAAGITFPSGNERHGLGSGKANYQIINAFSKEIRRVRLHLNLGWNFLDAAPDQLVVSTAVDYALNEKWYLLAEWNMSRDLTANRDGEANGVLFGLLCMASSSKSHFGFRMPGGRYS